MSSYSLSAYTSMLSDPVRVGAYEAALKNAVTPGCTVLEIGSGTGFFTVLACRLGAGVVHAVEPDESIQVARELAEANGVADRIVFHQAMSTRVELPEPADVLFSDLRGVLPLFEHHIATVTDARSRLLRPGGVQIPLRDRVYVAPVSAADAWAERVRPWGDNHLDVDLETTVRRLSNLWSKARFEPEQLAAPGRLWGELDYTRIVEPGLRNTLDFTLDAQGEVHGVAAWFETDLTDAVGFSNAPHAPPALYGHAFFPFPTPLTGAAGDRLEIDLRAHLVGDDYVWEWRAQHRPGAGPGAESGADASGTRFVQSTLAGTVLSPERFHRGAENHRPRLGLEGRIDAFVLGAMDGTASVGDIARGLREAFPERFSDYRAALNRVSDLSRDRAE